MDIKKCDRCDRPFESDNKDNENGIVFVHSDAGCVWRAKNKKVDLCPVCISRLRLFLVDATDIDNLMDKYYRKEESED